MTSINDNAGNFPQPLGESHSTRNQVVFFALLAIKNAFCLDRARNLQKLRKRRNNATWYLAQLGNKARKIHQVAQALPKQFSEASGIKLGKGMLPYVLSGLIVSAPFIGLFNKEAKAEPVDTGIDLALNTKAPVMPEGSNGNTAPLFKKASIPTEGERAPCADMHKCTRKEAYALSENQIMFHYPDDVVGVTILAEVLTEDGFTAVAVPGGTKPGIVEMRVNKSAVLRWTQDQINSGDAGGEAIRQFLSRVANKKIKEPPPSEETEIHSQLNIK